MTFLTTIANGGLMSAWTSDGMRYDTGSKAATVSWSPRYRSTDYSLGSLASGIGYTTLVNDGYNPLGPHPAAIGNRESSSGSDVWMKVINGPARRVIYGSGLTRVDSTRPTWDSYSGISEQVADGTTLSEVPDSPLLPEDSDYTSPYHLDLSDNDWPANGHMIPRKELPRRYTAEDYQPAHALTETDLDVVRRPLGQPIDIGSDERSNFDWRESLGSLKSTVTNLWQNGQSRLGWGW